MLPQPSYSLLVDGEAMTDRFHPRLPGTAGGLFPSIITTSRDEKMTSSHKNVYAKVCCECIFIDGFLSFQDRIEQNQTLNIKRAKNHKMHKEAFGLLQVSSLTFN